MKERGIQLTIARKTFPALRATSMRDFLNVLKELNVYRGDWHNKSDNIFNYPPTGSEVDFISLDDPTKVRSRRRKYLWLNEGNEFNLEDYRQLSMRTSGQIFMDYNPSHQFHWIYDKLEPKKDCIIMRSSYKDNPFLAREIVKEIEGYKDVDQNYWRIYGLGLRGIAESLIFTHWKYCDELPKSFDKMSYGIDFAFNKPTAIVKVVEKDDVYYWDEILYQSHLKDPELIAKMKEAGIKEGDDIFPDPEDPKTIDELRTAGFNMLESDNSVLPGIKCIKSKKLYITKRSVNIAKEARGYSWKTKNEILLDEPVKENDHLMDAGRYAQYSMAKAGGYGLEWL